MHNYKNLVSDSAACAQLCAPTTYPYLVQCFLSQIFCSICDVGLRQHRICSFPVLHLYTAVTKLERNPCFPFLNAGFPAGAEHSAFLPLTNIGKKKKLFTPFLCCHQIPASHYLPMFIRQRNMGSLKWFFFWCVQQY